MYKYRPEEAYGVVTEMLESDDKWMKISGVWVLGELEGDAKAAELLLKYKNDKDAHVKSRLLKSLSKLYNSEKKLPEDVAEKVSNAMANLLKA